MHTSSDSRPALVVKADGIDGCGKTTLLNSLFLAYSRRKLRVLLTSEFGSDLDKSASTIGDGSLSVSRVLNRLAKCPDCDLDDIERELLWAVASRRANRIVISQSLHAFDLILVDRSNLGNLAYGLVMNPGLECVFDLATTPAEIADLIFWIDTPVEICQQRLLQRSRDVIEAKGVSFFEEVRRRYEALTSAADHIRRLDGTQDITTLTAQAIRIINSCCGPHFFSLGRVDA